jgi:TDG/mug DNA glycosylase family protein
MTPPRTWPTAPARIRAEPTAPARTRVEPTAPRQARRAAPTKPTRDQVAAAAGSTIPDVIADDLRVLFCGINPGLYSGATGQHFSRPGNRFWPALHRGGFTDRELKPWECEELLAAGLGITNLAARSTARADELRPGELVAGARTLTDKAERHRPHWIAVVGVTAYRTGFGRPRATFGLQAERIGAAGLWVLPNPSGLNARFQIADLAAEFARLRQAASDTRTSHP